MVNNAIRRGWPCPEGRCRPGRRLWPGVIICDTSGLIAGYDERDQDGPAVRELLEVDAGSLIVSPFVLAEVDYMIMNRSGAAAELALLEDLADGVYQVAEFTQLDA